MNIIEEDTLPKREDCIHHVVCKHNDGCCPMECGYFNPPVQDNNIERVEIAEVGLACGRQYLKVAGVIVAVENDICRDPGIPKEYHHPRDEHHLKWMPEMLEYAAKIINLEYKKKGEG